MHKLVEPKTSDPFNQSENAQNLSWAIESILDHSPKVFKRGCNLWEEGSCTQDLRLCSEIKAVMIIGRIIAFSDSQILNNKKIFLPI